MSEHEEKRAAGYDVIVVGAGIVGSYFARRLSESGLQVLLLDRRKKEELGAWKNTGHNLDRRTFLELPIRPPADSEIMARFDQARFIPPVGEPFEFSLPTVNVRLREFTARINQEALDADVEFRDQTRVKDLIVENGFVKGLFAECEGQRLEFRSSLVADVSGIDAVVRAKLPPEFGFVKELSRRDYLLVYGEDWEIGLEHRPQFTYWPKWQGWSGPRKPGQIGLGLGRFAARDEDPREMFPDFAREVWPAGGKVVWKTFNRVPLRHPLHSLVGNGALLIGDSACMAKPLNGEGVSVMLFAAESAREAVVKAFEKGDLSAAGLWDYNRLFLADWGARFSIFHRLRYELLRMNQAELDFIFGMQMYGPEDMAGIMGRVEMSLSPGRVVRLIKAFGRGASRPDLLIRLARAAREGVKLKKLYEDYPKSPDRLPEWIKKVEALYHYT